MQRYPGMLAAAAVMCASAPAVMIDNRAIRAGDYEPIFVPGSPGTTRRGKHKLPRHGQKLKSCRVKIGRRVRRKHRRAA